MEADSPLLPQTLAGLFLFIGHDIEYDRYYSNNDQDGEYLKSCSHPV